jgi:hypothetical protein
MPAKPKVESALPLNVVLRSLVGQRTEIDQADDKLSDSLQRIQAVLRRAVATKIWVEIGVDESDGTLDFLAFGKYEGQFLLMYENGHYDNEGEPNCSHRNPVMNTAREFRARIFAEGHVEKLIRSASDQVAEQIAARAEALVAAKRIAEALDLLGDDSSSANESTSSSTDDLPF